LKCPTFNGQKSDSESEENFPKDGLKARGPGKKWSEYYFTGGAAAGLWEKKTRKISMTFEVNRIPM